MSDRSRNEQSFGAFNGLEAASLTEQFNRIAVRSLSFQGWSEQINSVSASSRTGKKTERGNGTDLIRADRIMLSLGNRPR